VSALCFFYPSQSDCKKVFGICSQGISSQARSFLPSQILPLSGVLYVQLFPAGTLLDRKRNAVSRGGRKEECKLYFPTPF